MHKPICLIYLNELEFKANLKTWAEEFGIECYFVMQGEQLYQLVKNWAPFMILVDLTAADTEWLYKHIAMIQLFKPGFQMLAIVPEHQERPRQRAEGYGCKFVLTRAEFVKKAPKLIEKILNKQM